MAYALRYYKEIAQTDGGVVRLEIHKKDSTTSAVEIGAVVQGLSLEIQGQQDDIDTPIQKTSLHMTFVDASDIENGQKNGFWEEFYTPDALMWRVILKAKDAGETSFRTIWGGYVTPDSFSEDLVYRGSVSITARDNIGHMQDFPFDALGDEDGLISLYNLVAMGWEKIQSPMDLLWNGLEWLSCNDVIAYHTLMNVSQFKDMNWYKAIETALASYGAVMRYAGENEVYVTTLRYMPSLGRNIDLMDRIDPVFIAGAQRELVPAVKRIEESVDYELEESTSQPQIKVSDFSGSTETYRCKIDGVDNGNGSFGTGEHDAPIWSINNTESWANTAGKSLFFNPHAYEIGYFSDRRGLGDEIKRFMYIAANNVDERSVSFSKTITCADLAIRIKFGLPISLNSEGGSMTIEQQNVFNLKSIRYSVVLVQNGVTNYLASHGGWVVDKQEITTEFDTSSQVSDFECVIGMGEFLGHADLTFTIHKIEYAQMSYANLADYGLYACIQDFALATPTSLSLREKNTVNTLYNADNNVILSRDPEIGPAYDNVAIPAFIKNGIFYRNGDEILPARLWSWGGSEQQMAVWNHLQLLCYYAKPNNLISGTIVNADITRVAAIYEWNHAEHILVSGRYNFLNGHIEGAVLREFARYEDMWSEVAGAAMPETEQDSRSNVEGGASSSASPSTYTATQNVNIGTGGGASSLRDLLDVDVSNAIAQSLLYYDGAMWVDMSLATLMNPYLKKEAPSQTIKGDIIIEGNLIVAGDTSTGGTGEDVGGGGILGIKVNGHTYYDKDDGVVDGIIDLGTITGGLTSVSWEDVQGRPTNVSEFLNDSGYLTSVNSEHYPALYDYGSYISFDFASSFKSKGQGSGYIEFYDSGWYNFRIGSLVVNGSAYVNGNEIYHAGNFNPADYLPKSGGTINGTLVMSAYGGSYSYDIAFYSANTSGSLGIKSDLLKWTFNGVENTIIHSGNIGSQSVGNSAKLDGYGISNFILYYDGVALDSTRGFGYGYISSGWHHNGPALSFGYNGVGGKYYSQLQTYEDGSNPVIRSNNNGTWSDWKTIAFTDSNVASATKLQTARTIWGQSFDGTGNVLANRGLGLMSSKEYYGLSILPIGSPYYGVRTFLTYDQGSTMGAFEIASRNFYGLTISHAGGVAYDFGNIPSDLPYTTLVNIRPNGNVLIGTTVENGSRCIIKHPNASVTSNSSALTIDSEWYNWGYQYCAMSFAYAGVEKAAIGWNSVPRSVSPTAGFCITNGVSDNRISLANEGGIFLDGAVTMSSTLSVGGDVFFKTAGKLDAYGNFHFTSPTTGSWAIVRGNGNDALLIDNATGNATIYGNLVVAGDTSTGSDIRFKDKLSDHRIALSDIAEAPLFTFKWNDREDDSVHLGSSAQYWEKVAPWLVKGEDFKTLDYSTLGVAIGISLANKAVNHEERIKILEKENKALKEQIRRIQYGS